MLGIVVFAVVFAATAIIVGTVIWGWHNDTLRESDQERFDRRFDEMVAADANPAFPWQRKS